MQHWEGWESMHRGYTGTTGREWCHDGAAGDRFNFYIASCGSSCVFDIQDKGGTRRNIKLHESAWTGNDVKK